MLQDKIDTTLEYVGMRQNPDKTENNEKQKTKQKMHKWPINT